jgi:hypothetical protein
MASRISPPKRSAAHFGIAPRAGEPVRRIVADGDRPGLPFPAEVPLYPSRADMVAYLERYVAGLNVSVMSARAAILRQLSPIGTRRVRALTRATASGPRPTRVGPRHRVCW